MKLAAAFSGMAAALGGHLFFCGAGTERWIGLAVFAAGIVSAVLCICGWKRQEKNILILHEQVMDFLEGRDETPRFSVNDHMFALLENSVVELENRLLLELRNSQKTSKKNADFIADVSHQLKTPLTALKFYCEMENENNPGQYTEKHLLHIERMEHLIYSLLRLEKLRADAYELKYAPHCLSELAGQVWAELHPLYPEIRFQITGKASMRCDAYWMGEALKNILKNSCEHTAPDGSIEVWMETGDASVIVTVEDSGGGIPEEALPAMFHRFYRSSRDLPNGGVGLGLAITRAIVEKHHGTIYAENTSRGLKITLNFPILDGILAISNLTET